MNNDGFVNIKGHAAEKLLKIIQVSDASSIVIITSVELFIPNTCFYENGSSLCTFPDCCHYVDRNNRPKVMLWKICTSTALFALNAGCDAIDGCV